MRGGPSRNLSKVQVRGLTINCFEKPREYEKQSNGEVILRVTGRPAQLASGSLTLPIACAAPT